MKTRSERRKITVKMWEPLLKKLNEDAATACLNRDAYLDAVLSHEAAMLVSDAAGRKNSDAARSFAKRCLLDLKAVRPVSLSLRAETADDIESACTEVNVSRDVFVNRVVYLLVVRRSSLENLWNLHFDDHTTAILDEGQDIQAILFEPRLAAIGSFVRKDPFLPLRVALREAYPDTKGELHMQPLGDPQGADVKSRGLVGFSTFLADSDVPGTAENEAHRKMLDSLLDF